MENQVETRVTYNLSEVNLASKTGVLRVREEDKRSGYKLNVTLSGQLIYKIKDYMKGNKKQIKLTNVDFTSTLMSNDYKANPLKLIKFTKEGEQPSFKLQMVDDKGHYFKNYVNAMNQRVDKIIFKHWKKSQYIRFWEVAL